jgi:hypothetical protein
MFVFAPVLVVGRRPLALDSRANSSLEGLKSKPGWVKRVGLLCGRSHPRSGARARDKTKTSRRHYH